jgi:hypothetical protein
VGARREGPRLDTLKDRLVLLDDVDELAINRVRQWLSAVGNA